MTVPYVTRSAGNVPDGSISTGELADDSVTADKLADHASTDASRAVTTNHIRDSAVTAAKVAADVATQAELDAHLGIYRTVAFESGLLFAATANKYILGLMASTNPTLLASGVTTVAGTTTEFPRSMLQLVAADYAATGLTTKVRVRSQVAINGTAPTLTFTVGLYPVTVAGGTNELNITIGTVVTGSTVAHLNPVANTVTSAVSTDISLPSDGFYALGVAVSDTMSNTIALVSAQLQMRHV